MLMLLTLATSARALADDDRQSYAVLDPTGTLTFYCDNQTRSGAMPLNEDYDLPIWEDNASSITTVVFSESFQYARPTTCYYWFSGCSNLTEIKGIQYLNTAEVTDMRYMFWGCESLESLDLSSFNTEWVTSMSSMFDGCESLESLNLSSFKTAEVIYMNYMFSNCSALETILVGSGWNVDKVTSSDDMFTGCKKLTGGNGTTYEDDKTDKIYAVIDGKDDKPGYLTDATKFKPYAVLEDNPGGGKTLVFRFGYMPDNAMPLNEDYNYPKWKDNASSITTVVFDPLFQYARPKTCFAWFFDCQKLTEINGIQYLNTSEVTIMQHMFNLCTALKSLDLSSFNTAKVTDMYSMFANCLGLRSLDLSSFNTENVTDMGTMFENCESLESLNLSSFNTENVNDMSYMFKDCSALKTILVGNGWNVDNVTSFDMFTDCEKLTGGEGFGYNDNNANDITNANTGTNGYLTSLERCTPYAVLEGKTLVFRFGYMPDNAMPLNEGDADPEWNNNASDITTVEFDPLFQYARPTSCYKWFLLCQILTEINGIEYLNTSKVTNMSGMFSYCSDLKSLDLSSFNTAKVTDMYGMFAYCSGLRSLDLSGFNTAKVTNMSSMFYGCKSLESLNLSSFNTAKVSNMSSMFYGCESLKSLDLSSFNTSVFTNMSSMFENCESLESLNLSSLNTEMVTDMNYMFYLCSALKTILVGSGWNVNVITSSDNMFSDCEKLTGGNGTTYTYDKPTDKTYAVIDGKDGKPGYLTLNALTLTKTNGITTAVLNGDFTDGIGAALIIDKEIKVDALTFNRKFTNGVTATVMFPFGFTAGNNIKGTFHTITKVGPDDNGVWTAELSNDITDIKANTPYIFNPTADISSIEFKGEGENKITLVPTDGTLTNGDDNGWQLHGVYSKKIWEDASNNEYGFAAEKVEVDNIEAGEFVRAGKGAWADPMRCYLTYKDGSESPFTAKSSVVLPDRIRVVFPQDPDDDITPATNPDDDITPATDPDEVITPVSPVSEPDEIKVWSFGGTVYIEAQPDMDYTIIDLSGRVIKKGATHSTREEVSLNAKGIVIVKIANKSFKIK